MRIHWMAWTAAALLVAPVAAMAQLTAAREQAFREKDKNGDGVLTQEEYGGHPGNFRAMDANGDGVLSRDEFVNRYRDGNASAPAQSSAPAPPSAPGLPAGTGGTPPLDVFALIDRNHDNAITRSEWRPELVTATFSQTDRNHDGVVTRDEFANPLPADSLEARFDQMDRNRDGVITRREWRGDPFSFNRVDRNNDDRITVDEYVNQPAASDRERRFQTLDRNRNGVISRGEWRGETMDFDDVDRNGDNRITLEECLDMDASDDYGPGATGREGRFARMDRNGDGVLTRSEWRESSSFSRADRNGDGVVTRREYLNADVLYEPTYDDNNYDNQYSGSRSERFRDLDVDGNGYVSRFEWPYDRSEFDMLDRNRDGRLTASEFSDTRLLAEQFRRMDDNGDGVIARWEWTGTAQSFRDYDRNHDGVISRDEFLYY